MAITGLPDMYAKLIGKELEAAPQGLVRKISRREYCPCVVRDNLIKDGWDKKHEPDLYFPKDYEELCELLFSLIDGFGQRTQKLRIFGYLGKRADDRGQKPDFLQYINYTIFGKNGFVYSNMDDKWYTEFFKRFDKEEKLEPFGLVKPQLPELPKDLEQCTTFLQRVFRNFDNGYEHTADLDMGRQLLEPRLRSDSTVVEMQKVFKKQDKMVDDLLEKKMKELDDKVNNQPLGAVAGKDKKSAGYSEITFTDIVKQCKSSGGNGASGKNAAGNVDSSEIPGKDEFLGIVKKFNKFENDEINPELTKKLDDLSTQYEHFAAREDTVVEQILKAIKNLLFKHNAKPYYKANAEEIMEDIKASAAIRQYGVSVIDDDKLIAERKYIGSALKRLSKYENNYNDVYIGKYLYIGKNLQQAKALLQEKYAQLTAEIERRGL